MAVTLRSGRELEEKRVEKNDTKKEKYVEIGEEFKQHNLENIEKEKIIKMQSKQQVEKENLGKMKRLKLTTLEFHSLGGCRRQGLKRNSLNS